MISDADLDGVRDFTIMDSIVASPPHTVIALHISLLHIKSQAMQGIFILAGTLNLLCNPSNFVLKIE